MAKILFTWELGDGSGHIMPYVDLIDCLIEQGHEVHFALRHVHKAYRIFKDKGVVWHQAPYTLMRHVERVLPVHGYAKILHHAGHDKVSNSLSLIVAWKNLFTIVRPDLIVFDYSPSAMLAARTYSAKTLSIGTGFHLPPASSPMPSVLENSSKEELQERISFEKRVLDVLNEALNRMGAEPLVTISDVMKSDDTILRTLPELDHFPERKNAKYGGIMNSPKGISPVWPEGEGPKIFAYLKPSETLPVLLRKLNAMKYPVLIYGNDIREKIIDNFSSDTLRFVEQPLDMKMIGESADLAILNAGHGSVAEMLLSGVPLLLLPLQGEQVLVSRNVERIGAGLSVLNLSPMEVVNKLERLIIEPRFKKTAQDFAERYALNDDINLTPVIFKAIDAMLA